MDTTLRDALKHLQKERAPTPAERDPEVMQMVREQLQREPPPSLAALYGRAVRINPAIRKLTLRQFNARYPLQVRRRMKAERSATRSSSGNGRNRGREGRSRAPDDRIDPDELRARVRPVLLRYARAVAAAESTADLIDVLEEVDSYVDAVLDSIGHGAGSAGRVDT